jgi:NADH:ubiquinone oxidoreductase subunit E
MTGEASGQRVARGLAIGSGTVALACTLWLVTGYVVDLAGAPAAAEQVAELEERVKTDPEAAELLHAERERQTEASLARKSRNRLLAWLLLGAGGLFVAGEKWLASFRPRSVPTLDDLVADRFPVPAGPKKKLLSLPSGGNDHLDLAHVDGFVSRFGTSREAAIPILQAIQEHYRYLPDEALERVVATTDVSAAQIAGTSSFYAQFRRSPVGRHVVRVCHGTACHVAGAGQITQELRRHLDIPAGEDTDARRQFTIDSVACLGCCSLAPVMMIEEETAGHLTPSSARQTLDALAEES